MDSSASPYRLQVWFPREVQPMLNDLAHEERTTIQGLVRQWVLERIRSYPRYASVDPPANPPQAD